MKNLKMVKKLTIIMVSILFMLMYSNNAFAVDSSDDLFTEANFSNISNTNGNTASNSTSNTGSTTNNSTTNNSSNTDSSSLTSGNNSNTSNTNASNTNRTNNTNNSNTNRSVSNTNALANTGIEDIGGIIALIVVICGISAIYSYKKVNDYKKL